MGPCQDDIILIITIILSYDGVCSYDLLLELRIQHLGEDVVRHLHYEDKRNTIQEQVDPICVLRNVGNFRRYKYVTSPLGDRSEGIL